MLHGYCSTDVHLSPPDSHTHIHADVHWERMSEILRASSRLNILPHLVDGTGTFLCFAGVGPAWLMGLNERGHDPCYELLPVTVEGVFRGLRWSQEIHPVWGDAATAENIHQQGEILHVHSRLEPACSLMGQDLMLKQQLLTFLVAYEQHKNNIKSNFIITSAHYFYDFCENPVEHKTQANWL